MIVANRKSSRLAWSQPVHDVTILFRRRTWLSRCRTWKVEEHVPTLASDTVVRWYVLRLEGQLGNWWIVSKHRRRSAQEGGNGRG